MAKLTEFQNPFSGQKGSIFDIGQLWSMILGVFVLFLVFALGQNVARRVSGAVPFADTTVEKPWADPPQVQTNTKRVA